MVWLGTELQAGTHFPSEVAYRFITEKFDATLVLIF